MKKLLKMLVLVFFLLIVFIYTIVIENIPNKIVVFQGEDISMQSLFGISIKQKNLETIET